MELLGMELRKVNGANASDERRNRAFTRNSHKAKSKTGQGRGLFLKRRIRALRGGVNHPVPTTWAAGVIQIWPISPFWIVTCRVGLFHLVISSPCKVEGCREWCLQREDIMGLLMTSIGTQSKMGQIPGTLAKGVNIRDFRCLYPLPFGGKCLHGWKRGLFFNRRITALLGVVGHLAPTFG